MFDLIAFFIALLIAFVVATAGYKAARKFWRDKLRYVASAHRSGAPWVAAIAAFVVALPIAGILPFVGLGTAIAFALSVGTGAAAGMRDVKEGNYYSITSG